MSFLTPTDQNIDRIIELCKKGDHRAQLGIYNRYYKAMYNTSLRIVKDPYRAEDIMQESFLKAFSKLNNLRDANMFGAWLKRIVVNNSIYQYHKTNSSIEVPFDDVLYKIEDSEVAHEDSMQNMALNHLTNAMNQLKSNYYLVLTLHYIEGYDYDEICTILKISNANCRTMISRAKDSLRKILRTSPKMNA